MSSDTSRPALFFRYQAFRPSLDRDREILLESRLWCSTPDQFNDPFEVRPHIHWDGEPIPNKKRVQQLAEKKFPELSSEELAQKVEEGLQNLERPTVVAEFQSAAKEIVEGFRKTSICCFAASAADIRMWSYYASGHAGYCVGFSFDTPWTYADADGEVHSLQPDPVRYSDEYPSVNQCWDVRDPAASQQYVEMALLSKALEWFGEREWRCLRPWTPAGHQAFPADALRVLVLGALMPPERQSEMIKLVRSRSHQVDVYRAKPREREFKLHLERVEQ